MQFNYWSILVSIIITPYEVSATNAERGSSLPVDTNDNIHVHQIEKRLKRTAHQLGHGHASSHYHGLPNASPKFRHAGAHSIEQQPERHSLEDATQNISSSRSWPTTLKQFVVGLTDPILKANIQTSSASQAGSPGLSHYCSGGGSSNTAAEGMRIKADWKDYGTFYKGRVTEVNKDGSYDIKYDDGFVEKNVRPKNVHTVKKRGHKVNPSKTDPACKIAQDVADLKKAVEDSQADMTSYLDYRKKKKKHRNRKKNLGGKPARHKGARELDDDKKSTYKYHYDPDWYDKWWADWKAKYGGYDTTAMDKNDDKKVTKDEIKTSMKDDLGYSEEKAEAHSTAIMKKLDPEGTGSISTEDLAKHGEEAEKDAQATQVLKDMNEKFGSKEEVRKAVDQDGDDTVTHEEIATALEEKMGKTREESEALAKHVMKKLGAGDGESASADKLEEAVEKATTGSSEAADDGESTSAADDDRDLAELSDAEKEEMIRKLKDEVKDRDEELVEREESMDKFQDKIKEFKDTMAKDHEEEDGRAVPDTPEGKDEEIKRLRAKIQKRAESLDDVLDREEEQRKLIDYQEAQENQEDGMDQKALLENMEKHSKNIKAMVEKLKKKMGEMDGEMDPELTAMVSKVSGAADKITGKMETVVTTERKLDADRRSGKDLQDQEAAAKAEDDLDKQIEELDKDVQHLKQDTTKIDTEIVPHGDKWWRYRWEYCFVESSMLAIFCILAIFWEGIHQFLRRKIKELSRQSPFFNAVHHHNTMYHHWWSFMTGEMFVLMLVVFTLWVLNRCHAYEWWIEHQFDLLPDMHLPTEAKLYARTGNDIAMQVFFSLIAFFGIAFTIVRSAVHKECHWKEFEETQQAGQDTSRSAVSLVIDQEEFNTMRRQFISGINAHPDLTEEAKLINDDNFLFWLYLALNVRHTMTHIYNIKIVTWVLFLFIFICFAVLHLHFHFGWIRLFCFFFALTVALFVYMIVKVKQSVKDLDSDADNAHAFQGKSWHEKYDTESWACTALQFSLFFNCYGIARTICSPYLWEYEFWLAVGLVVAFVVFLFVFRHFCAPIIVVFLVIMALPPHIDPSNLAILHEVQILSDDFRKPKEEVHEDRARVFSCTLGG